MSDQPKANLQFKVDAELGQRKQESELTAALARKYKRQRFDVLANAFMESCDELGASRELSLAKTKMEEARMWAFQHLDRQA